ncbi:MAG: ATP-binding cassette domain-containing protein [Pyrinomonadaceae bacterium]|nr:ATP-binding cassette domain-containing protein [Pyrinomonadaceae bacterium]
MPDVSTFPVVFRSVSYEAGGTKILNGLDLSIGKGEVVVLLGESGCGKTTTLKMINRMIEPTAGTIEVFSRNTLDQDSIELRRRIGYVMQEGGLFPHMTVAENVAIVPTLAGWDSGRKRERAEELLSLVGLEPAKFAGRLPHELSGGQRQRVGVARALAAEPELILLDEPFGALDALTRTRLQREFAELTKDLGMTAVFVTHDLHEAMLLGSRIALMDHGQIVFLGSPEEFSDADVPLARAYLETIG